MRVSAFGNSVIHEIFFEFLQPLRDLRTQRFSVEDKKDAVTFALRTVNNSATHSTRTRKVKLNVKEARTMGSTETSIHTREGAPMFVETTMLLKNGSMAIMLWAKNTG